MATKSKRTKIGLYDCWSCKREVVVKRTDTGKLSAPCQHCEFPHYANEATEHFDRLMACVRPDPLDAKPAPAADPPKVDVPPAAAPAATQKRSLNPFGR